MVFNGADPPMKDDVKECLEDIRDWNYYDNYQHGKYADENSGEYHPIRVFNATVKVEATIVGEECYYSDFQGDISQKRLEYLQQLTQKFDCFVEIFYESHNDSKLYHSVYYKGIDILVIDIDTRKPYACKHRFEYIKNRYDYMCHCGQMLNDIFKRCL